MAPINEIPPGSKLCGMVLKKEIVESTARSRFLARSQVFFKIQSRMKEKSWHQTLKKYHAKMQKAKVNPKTHKKYLEKKSIKNG